MKRRIRILATGTLLLLLAGTVLLQTAATVEAEKAAPKAAEPSWPMQGGSLGRNMASPAEKNITFDFSVTKGKLKNVKWSAALGKSGYGGVVIAGGKIFVGTNNEAPRDPKIVGDKGILMCFNAADGKFLWQAVHDKLPDEAENDYAHNGVVSTPAIDGNRIYYVSNRCELVCADVDGDPKNPGKALIHWSLDMMDKKGLNVYPNQASTGSPLVIGDLVFTLTSNGVSVNTNKVVNPEAPSFIAVNKKTGKVVWQDASPGGNIMEGQWSNPAAAEVDGVMQVIVPFGDGWLRAFEATSGKLLWKFNCNPKKSAYKPSGGGDRNYFVNTPVVVDNKVYIGVGRNPDLGAGVGHLWCIDITRKPKNKDLDLSPVNDNFDPKAEVNKDSGLVWHYGGVIDPPPANGDREFVFGRTSSTMCIHEGLLYAVELDGFVHCLDARTGKAHWVHDMKTGSWNSAYYVDGKVLVGNESGDLLIFTHGKEFKEPTKIDLLSSLKVPPVALGGVLYVNNGSTIFAIAAPK